MKIRFCESCGRMILAGFEFCPYCGACLQLERAREASSGRGNLAPWRIDNGGDSVPDVSAENLPLPLGIGEGRVLLDRLIRDLETLDAEIAELESVHSGR